MSAAFSPGPDTANIVVSAASQRETFKGDNALRSVRIYNDGTATVWVAFGDGTVNAALASAMPVGAGVCEVVTTSATHVAAIAAGSTGTIYFTAGNGI